MKGMTPVRVRAWADTDGRITPEAFTLRGQTLAIDRVDERREARATKAGGQGTRYTVRTGQAMFRLFMDDGRRWYLEEDCDVREIPCDDGG